jgi:hypothetical protein
MSLEFNGDDVRSNGSVQVARCVPFEEYADKIRPGLGRIKQTGMPDSCILLIMVNGSGEYYCYELTDRISEYIQNVLPELRFAIKTTDEPPGSSIVEMRIVPVGSPMIDNDLFGSGHVFYSYDRDKSDVKQTVKPGWIYRLIRRFFRKS